MKVIIFLVILTIIKCLAMLMKVHILSHVQGDRVLNETKNWDKKLEEYKNFFEDGIFRIRCSSHKLRSYFDFWECCFAPSNITFTTSKLIKIIGDLSPCFSHDAFQRCLFFYLESHDNF